MKFYRILYGEAEGLNFGSRPKEAVEAEAFPLTLPDGRVIAVKTCWVKKIHAAGYKVIGRVTENCNKINHAQAPELWLGLCTLENTQFCAFSEDGYHHGLSVCDDCPYKK